MKPGYGAFTLTETDTETETDKMASIPNGIQCLSAVCTSTHKSMQAIFFFISLSIGLGLC